MAEEVKITVLAKYSLKFRYSVDIYGGLVSPLERVAIRLT